MKEFKLRKPIRAIQWTGSNIEEFKKWLPFEFANDTPVLLVVKTSSWTGCLHRDDWLAFTKNSLNPEVMDNRTFGTLYISADILDQPLNSFA